MEAVEKGTVRIGEPIKIEPRLQVASQQERTRESESFPRVRNNKH